MIKSPRVLILTMHAPTGPTGVHTHFQEAQVWLESEGIDTRIVTPHAINSSLLRKMRNQLIRMWRRIASDSAIRLQRTLLESDVDNRIGDELRSIGSDRVIVYAQDPTAASAAIKFRKKKRLNNMKIVLVAHFNISEAYEYRSANKTEEDSSLCKWLTRLERSVVPNLDHLLVPSMFMRNELMKRHATLGTSVPVSVIPNFVSATTVARPILEPEFDLISIATLEPRKNQEYLLRVLAAAKSRGHRFSLLIVGDGPDFDFLSGLSRQLELSDQVSFAGRKLDARSLIMTARAYAHAAVMENCPISLIEAMAAGVPILAAPVGGIPDMFVDGCEGFFWDLSDPHQGADRLITMLTNHSVYLQFCGASLDKYHTHFSPQIQGPRLTEALLG